MRFTFEISVDVYEVSEDGVLHCAIIPAGTHEFVEIDNPIRARGKWWVLKDDKKRGAVCGWWCEQITNGVVEVESWE